MQDQTKCLPADGGLGWFKAEPEKDLNNWSGFLWEEDAAWRASGEKKEMLKTVRFYGSLAAVLALLSGVSFAQSGGEATYKAKCAMCHGATGLADSGAGKSMNVKPVTDADVKKMSEAEMITVTTTGKGKMPGYKDKLTDAQIKDSVSYYRSLMK